MKLLGVAQGSPQWLATRKGYFCASEAPVMMGTSAYMTRAALVRMKALGLEKEFSAWEQENLLRRGQKVEPVGRAYAEKLIGEELYPVTGVDDGDLLLASFDGITMAGDVSFEGKLWNQELVAAVREGVVPDTHWPQLEHQCIVGGLQLVIFVVTDGEENTIHCEYRSTPERRKAILDGWKQFDEDVRNYKHVEVKEAPKGRALMALPYLDVEVSGEVQRSNLVEYRTRALAAIESINTNLQSDQDFADAAETVKFCDDAEKKLEAAKEQALARTKSVAELFAMLDELREAFRRKRLDLDKLVTRRKQDLRAEILHEGQAALATHVAGLNTRIGRSFMPSVPADFAGAMKGKKTIQSLRDAVDLELARAKILANSIADRIGINLNTLRDQGKGYDFLFADLATVVLKENDDFATMLKLRIAEHKQREEARIQREAATRVAAPAAALTTERPMGGGMANNVVAIRHPQRPCDEELVAVIAVHYHVHESVVVAWLRTFDLDQAAARYTNETVGA